MRSGDTVFIAALVGGSLIAAVGIIGAETENSHTPVVRCQYEDEVPIQVLKDSYQFNAGDALCIHIDQLDPANEGLPR